MFSNIFGSSSTEEEPETPVPEVPVKKQTTSQKEKVKTEINQTKTEISETEGMPKLSTPVKFEDYGKESKTTLSTNEFFDGLRFELQRTIEEGPEAAFQIGHSISMGSVLEPAAYNFSPNVIYKGIFAHGRIDTDGQVACRWQQQFSPNLLFRAQAQLSPDDSHDNFFMEADYKGSNWFGNIKWSPSNYAIAYMQSITPSLSMGMETLYSSEQGLSMSNLAARYDTQSYVAAGALSMGVITGSYLQKISERISLATDLTLAMPPGSGMIESSYTVGFEYALKQSHIKTRIDSNWKVSCILEEFINSNTKFAICGELDHKKKNYRFGIGVSMLL